MAESFLSDWTNGVNREEILKKSANAYSFENYAKTYLSSDVAWRAGQIYAAAPWIKADTILTLAKGGASPSAVDTVAELEAYQRLQEEKNKRNKSWWERNIYDKVKTASRWGQAAMQFLPELGMNFASDLMDESEGGFWDTDSASGWFASTSLGTMAGNSRKSGDGWFIGGEAKTIQEERARDYRGTIAGTNSAFTLGRGLGSIFFAPGSKPYNILSGIVDGGVSIVLDPVGKLFGGAKGLTRSFQRGATSMPNISQETATLAARVATGLADAKTIAAWNASGVNRWLQQSRYAERLANFLAETKSPSKIMAAFKDKIPPEVALALSKMDDPDQVRAAIAALGSPLGLVDGIGDDAIRAFNLDPSMKIGSLSDIKVARRNLIGNGIEGASQRLFNASWREVMPGATTWHKWMETKVGRNFLLVNGSSAQRASAVDNLRRYLDTIANDISDDNWNSIFDDIIERGDLDQDLIDEFFTVDADGVRVPKAKDAQALKDIFMDFAVSAYSKPYGTQDAVKATSTIFNSMIAGVLRANGVKGEVISETLKNVNDATTRFRRYFIERAVSGDDPGLMQRLIDSGMVDEEALLKILDGARPGATIDDLKILSPLDLSDLLNTTIALPDFRTIRRLSANRMWRRTAQRVYVTSSGKLRGPIQLVDKLQNDYWKQIALMTGGYIMRNVLDGQVRMGLRGEVAGIFNGPFRFIGWAMNKRGPGNIVGQAFDYDTLVETSDDVLENTSLKYYMDTQETAGGRHLADVEETLNDVVRTGDVGIAQRAYEPQLHTQAIADQMGRGRSAMTLRLIVEGKTTAEIVDILMSRAPGSEAALNALKSAHRDGFWASAPGIKHRFKIRFKPGWENDPQLTRDYLTALIDGNYRQRVSWLLKPENEDLRFAFLNNRAPRGAADQMVVTNVDGTRLNEGWDIVEGPGSFGRTDEVDVGSLLYEEESGKNLLVTSKTVVNGETVIDYREVSDYAMFVDDPNLPASDELKRLIDNSADEGYIPDTEVYFKRAEVDPGEAEWMKKVGDWWFNQVVGKRFMRRLEKNPFWRQYYYKHVAENIDLLSPEEAQKLISNIETAAAKVGMSPAQYVGGGPLARFKAKIGSWEISIGDKRWKEIESAVYGREARLLDEGAPGAIDKVDEEVGNLMNTLDDLDGAKDEIESTIAKLEKEYDDLVQAQGNTGLFATGPEADDISARLKEARIEKAKLEAQILDTTDELFNARRFTTAATGTVDQLDEFAGYMATQDMKRKFYDGVDKNNFADAMRVIAPFGAAWGKILNDNVRLLVTDPSAARRAQRTFVALEEADPMNTGHGFFYKNPINGQLSFAFPLSGEISWLVTKAITGEGTYAQLTAPVKQLSLGYSFIPALGPVATIAANSLFDFIGNPSWTDEITQIFMPYGRGGGISGVIGSMGPFAFVKKTVDAIIANPNKTNTIFATTFMETVRAYSTTGKYDLSTDEGKDQLLEDAKDAARVLTAMRAASQFIGPTAGSIEFTVDTKQGDMYAGMLAKEFYKLQAENYDTAVEKFVDTYGEDVILYMSSKSKAVVRGIEPTDQFVAWQRENQGFLNSNANVGSYFAPGGDDFSFAAWDRMIRSGQFKRQTAREMIDDAQYKIASAKFRYARSKVGSYPDKNQSAWLREYREKLNAEYPGFPRVAQFMVGEFDEVIDDLKKAVQHKSVKNTEIAKAISEYLDRRDQALQSLKDMGLAGTTQSMRAEAAIPTRAWLASIAYEIIKDVPEFGRIFDRELAAEVEN
jgi:hypothetical protein